MNLHELKKGEVIMVKMEDGKDRGFIFDHLDGMYSYSTDVYGNVIHLSRFTPLKKWEKGDAWIIDETS